jgi:acetylornithine/N-succinyldiaminopimelate aminotransferase
MTIALPPDVAPPVAEDTARGIMELERAHVFQNYARYPVVLERGKGCYVFDMQGRRYLDWITGIGVNALGHGHPRIVKVIREQAGRLLHSSNLYYHPYQGPLAARLARMSGLDRVFFANTGTEAAEFALKIARANGRSIHPEKYEILSLDNSFHGRTLGALSITGQPKYRTDFEPLLPGVRFVPINDIAALEGAVNERTAAIFLEMIQGEGGIYPLTHEYIVKARELADRHGALLVADETQCGVGRPGVYFAYQLAQPAIVPDVVYAAKPVACGIPLGFVIANEKAAAAIKPGMHGSTFGGGPLACRVSLEFLDILEELLPSIQKMGTHFKSRLEELARKHACVKEVRGFGLMLGMELTIPGKQIVLDAIEAGLMINCTHERILRFLPTYTISEAEIERGIRILNKLLGKADSSH